MCVATSRLHGCRAVVRSQLGDEEAEARLSNLVASRDPLFVDVYKRYYEIKDGSARGAGGMGRGWSRGGVGAAFARNRADDSGDDGSSSRAGIGGHSPATARVPLKPVRQNVGRTAVPAGAGVAVTVVGVRQGAAARSPVASPRPASPVRAKARRPRKKSEMSTDDRVYYVQLARCATAMFGFAAVTSINRLLGVAGLPLVVAKVCHGVRVRGVFAGVICTLPVLQDHAAKVEQVCKNTRYRSCLVARVWLVGRCRRRCRRRCAGRASSSGARPLRRG